MSDLSVIGLDLDTGREVYIDESNAEQWRAKGYRGDQTVVCLYCYHGDGVPPGTRVPLVVKFVLGGARRAHFAHPPGQGPAGGHGPETVWHVEGKHLLARWAAGLPQVGVAIPEQYTADRKRRADVSIRFTAGDQMALELQSRPIVDPDWLVRHLNYRQAGIVDVWLCRPNMRPPGVLLEHGVSVVYLDVAAERIGFPIAYPHRSSSGERVYSVAHMPPCVGDDVNVEWAHLADLDLEPHGFRLPARLAGFLAAERAPATHPAKVLDARESKAAQRKQPKGRRSHGNQPGLPGQETTGPQGDRSAPPAWSSLSTPTLSTASQRRCDLCGEPLGEYWHNFGRHPRCGLRLREQPQR